MHKLSEKADEELFLGREKSSHPKLVVKGGKLKFDELQTYIIVIEGEEMENTKDFLKAIALLFAVYYIFNMAFPPKMKSMLFFFTKFIFRINDETIKDKKVANFHARLLPTTFGQTFSSKRQSFSSFSQVIMQTFPSHLSFFFS